jgi:peptidoglycan/xylan/chitin deacetylase (PgdA/CDA1 family)
MYHHVNSDRCSNSLTMLQSHLRYISHNYTTVFPSQQLTCKRPICLVFDDGYFDFYKYIFPLLKQYNLKALLAVSPKFILETTQTEDEARLDFEHNDLYINSEKATFCTYEELKTMAESGHVQIASHSFSHVNLLEDNIDLIQELKGSKEILEEKLDIHVESFVFPYGKYDQHILNETKKHYSYAFRIGNAFNDDFTGIKGVIYRIDADNLQTPDEIFKFTKMLKYRYKKFIKTLVGNR